MGATRRRARPAGEGAAPSASRVPAARATQWPITKWLKKEATRGEGVQRRKPRRRKKKTRRETSDLRGLAERENLK